MSLRELEVRARRRPARRPRNGGAAAQPVAVLVGKQRFLEDLRVSRARETAAEETDEDVVPAKDRQDQ